MEKDSLFLYIFNNEINVNDIRMVFCHNELLENTEGVIKSNLDKNSDLANTISNIDSKDEQNKILSIYNYTIYNDNKDFIKINNIYFTEQGLKKKQEFLEIINENLNKNIEITIFDRKEISAENNYVFNSNQTSDSLNFVDFNNKELSKTDNNSSHNKYDVLDELEFFCEDKNLSELLFENKQKEMSNEIFEQKDSSAFGSKSEISDIKQEEVEIINVRYKPINMFYDAEYLNGYQNGAGKQLEHGILLITLFLTDDELKYLLENENTNLHFKLPNTNLTQHYFIKVLDSNNQEICQYNNNDTKNADNQLLSYTIQGYSSCFYFSLFFLKEAVKYVVDKKQEFNKSKFIEEFKKPIKNLKITEKIINFFTNKNNLLFIIKDNKQVFSQNEFEKYFIFDAKENDELVFVNKNADNLTINKFGINEISTDEIISHYNILNYCSEKLLINNSQKEELTIKLELLKQQAQNCITVNSNTKSNSKSQDIKKHSLELSENIIKATKNFSTIELNDLNIN